MVELRLYKRWDAVKEAEWREGRLASGLIKGVAGPGESDEKSQRMCFTRELMKTPRINTLAPGRKASLLQKLHSRARINFFRPFLPPLSNDN